MRLFRRNAYYETHQATCDRYRKKSNILKWKKLDFTIWKNTSLLYFFRKNNNFRPQQKISSIRQNFLSNRIFDKWNPLPPEVVTAPSINIFKNATTDGYQLSIHKLHHLLNFFFWVNRYIASTRIVYYIIIIVS